MSISSLLLRGLKRGVWVWDDATNELQFDSLIKERKQKKQKETKGYAAINGLTYAALKVDLKFKQTVSENEIRDFRHFLRDQGRVNSIVTIEDCKMVAIFLCIQQLPNLFHKFFNLLSVNQLLRACIVYIQYYLKTCETTVKTQHFLKGNPLSAGKKSTGQILKEDLDDLRVLIGRFYAGIVFSEFSSSDISRTDEIMLFECFLRVSTIVVWIALERKYLNLIKVELERIFRTGFFNNFSVHDPAGILQSIKPESLVILHGKIADINKRMNRVPSRLTSNSPVVHNFLRMDEPKLIMIGRQDFEGLQDNRLKFLTKYIFLPETEIQQEGVSIGILGLHRRLFDSLLYPCTKRTLKLLVTGSPMDITEERKRLREVAIKKSHRESEPQSPNIFNELPKIPRPNTFGEEETVEEENVLEKSLQETDGEEDEKEEEFDGEWEEDEETILESGV